MAGDVRTQPRETLRVPGVDVLRSCLDNAMCGKGPVNGPAARAAFKLLEKFLVAEANNR